MERVRKAKTWRPSAAAHGIEPGSAERKVAILLERRVLPAVCARADLLVATLSLLPLTVAEMRETSWRAVRMVARLSDAKEEAIQSGLAEFDRLTRGGPGGSADVLHPILRRRRLVRAALEARLRRCERRPLEPGRLSPVDWEFSWSLFLRPMLVLDLELATALDGVLTGNARFG